MSEEFKAINGDIIQLQFLPNNDGRRYNVTVLGFLEGHSLIVATPKKDGNFMIIREGQMFTARIMHGVSVAGFQTQVIKSVSTPYPYIHLRIPVEFEKKQVRLTRRADIHLAVTATNIKKSDLIKQKDATIIDLSLLGCRMLAEDILGSEGDRLKLTMTMNLFNHEYMLSITTTIKRLEESMHDNELMFEYGLAFNDLGEQASLVIGSYVNESLIQHFLE
ncbi:MAG: flagellar brake protein [Gammaproteobacteria bacterium]|nr:flagellar brake protein [Gammaproteobacteria bacterium]